MIYTKKESIEDMVVRALAERNHTIVSLIKEISLKKRATAQGVYKTLRFLRNEEVVIKNQEVFSLSEEWRNKVIKELENSENRFELSEGENIQLALNSLVHLDQQWKNIVIPFHENHPNYPIFFYNPHDIWIHLSETRKKSEIEYYKNLEESQTYVFIANGGNTLFDKEIKKQRSGNFIQITIGEVLFKNTDYITIFNDYIIMVRVSQKLAKEIEECYQNAKDTEHLEYLLKKIGIEKKRVKLFIEKNREKAKKLRRKISKDFHVPNEIISKFNLW